jgi:hypothetical protein
MDTLFDIKALRPKAEDSVSIAAAIEAAEAAQVAAEAHAKERAAFRAGALLTATEDELIEAERDAARARLIIDRIGALLQKLRGELADALRRERLDGVRRTIEEANAAQAAFTDA